RAPYQWHDLFQRLSWHYHTNYPLLQKGFIARCWLLINDETVWIPITFSFIIAFCTIGLVTSSVSILSNRTSGLIAGLALLCTPFYMTMAFSQYADNTVGYFYLASVVLLIYARHSTGVNYRVLFLAGVASGLTAWSKNEGLFFIVSLFISQLSFLFFGKNYRELLKEFKYILAGLLPVLAVVLYFKFVIAPTNEIVSAQGSKTLDKLTDYSRYEIAFSWYWNRISNFGDWIVNPWWLFLVGILLNIRNIQKNARVIIPYVILIVLMLMGGFFVFIIAELDMVSYLSSSVHRLYFQLFPLFLLLYFIAISEKKPLR
ncbi:MAG TPA: glycosyltransferase family 39 protein, partial [Arachidicoccus sp.]